MKIKKPDIPESKIEKDIQVDKAPVKEETIQKPSKDAKPVLIAKSGDTDLRRGAKELGKVVENMGMDPHDGTMYAFSNMKNSIKVLQEKENGTVLVINKTKSPIEGWPEYKPKGEEGHAVKFSGKELKQFIEKIGLPKNK